MGFSGTDRVLEWRVDGRSSGRSGREVHLKTDLLLFSCRQGL